MELSASGRKDIRPVSPGRERRWKPKPSGPGELCRRKCAPGPAVCRAGAFRAELRTERCPGLARGSLADKTPPRGATAASRQREFIAPRGLRGFYRGVTSGRGLTPAGFAAAPPCGSAILRYYGAGRNLHTTGRVICILRGA